jgi:hypothetical protein
LVHEDDIQEMNSEVHQVHGQGIQSCGGIIDGKTQHRQRLVHEQVITGKITPDGIRGKMKDIRVIEKIIHIIEGKYGVVQGCRIEDCGQKKDEHKDHGRENLRLRNPVDFIAYPV